MPSDIALAVVLWGALASVPPLLCPAGTAEAPFFGVEAKASGDELYGCLYRNRRDDTLTVVLDWTDVEEGRRSTFRPPLRGDMGRWQLVSPYLRQCLSSAVQDCPLALNPSLDVEASKRRRMVCQASAPAQSRLTVEVEGEVLRTSLVRKGLSQDDVLQSLGFQVDPSHTYTFTVDAHRTVAQWRVLDWHTLTIWGPAAMQVQAHDSAGAEVRTTHYNDKLTLEVKVGGQDGAQQLTTFLTVRDQKRQNRGLAFWMESHDAYALEGEDVVTHSRNSPARPGACTLEIEAP